MGMPPCGAALLSDGRVLVLRESAVALYDPATGTFRAAVDDESDSDLPLYSRAAELPDGRVVLAGAFGDVAVFDPHAETVTALDVRPEGQSSTANNLVPIVLPDGQAMLFASIGSLNAFSLDVSNDNMRDVASASHGGEVIAAFLDGGNVIVASRGWVDVYDTATEKFTASTSVRVLDNDGASVTMLRDGKLLVAGGLGFGFSGDVPMSDAFVVDPVTGSFQSTGSMSTGRAHHGAALLDDGRVLVVGGHAGSSLDRTPTNVFTPGAELYDPDSGTFVDVPAPLGRRREVIAVALPGDRVLAFGDASFEGDKYTVDATSAELFAIGTKFGIPLDCCSQPHDISVLEAVSAVSAWNDQGAQLMARITLPPGAAKGLESVHLTLDGSTVTAFPNGTEPKTAQMPPDTCVDHGCEYTIPLAVDLNADRLTGLSAWVNFTYSADAPASAADISITIELAEHP